MPRSKRVILRRDEYEWDGKLDMHSPLLPEHQVDISYRNRAKRQQKMKKLRSQRVQYAPDSIYIPINH